MEKQEKPDITTGNGITKTPILESESDPTVVQSQVPPKAASTEPSSTAGETNGTKPQSLSETVSLLQTDCFDLRAFGCKVAILAKDGKLYIGIDHPEHTFTFDTGNILIDGIEAVKQ